LDKQHDFSSFTAPGGSRFKEWTNGDTPYTFKKGESDEVARSRRFYVKRAMQHAWQSYEQYAFGHDELLPRTLSGQDNWGGMGTTLVDSLDTLWLMNMTDEFQRARDWIDKSLTSDRQRLVSVFETTIRSLGGLLSAYDFSQDEVFLRQAHDLGNRLFKAFDNPSGIPWGQVNLRTGDTRNIGWSGNNAILSEFSTMQIEFRTLARLTGNKEFKEKSEKVFEILKDMNPPNGLYPYFVRNTSGGRPSFANAKLTFGAMADSMYEYMLKIWLQGGKTEHMYREMYDKSMQGMHDELLQVSSPSGLVFIADKNSGSLDTKMDHLVCFMGGLLALGAYTDPLGLNSERAQRDLKTAKVSKNQQYHTFWFWLLWPWMRWSAGFVFFFFRFLHSTLSLLLFIFIIILYRH
jgi:mannosyl-oligosaccharide alpha-1,2-mannosidase